MSKSATFPGLGGRRSGRARDQTSLDDVLGDLLGSDDDTPTTKKKFGFQSSPKPRRVDDDPDFYSNLAAELGESELSEVSDADMTDVNKVLHDMGDMDDDLLGSLKRKSKPSKAEPEKQPPPTRRGKDAVISKPDTKDIDDELSKLLNQSLKDNSQPKSSQSKPRYDLSKQRKSIDYTSLPVDEEDPLKGLISDDEDDEKSETKKAAESTPSDTTYELPVQTEKPKVTKVPKKRKDDIDLGDDINVLDALGFDDSPRPGKKVGKDDDEILKAKSKVNELFGSRPSSASKSLERPPTGERRQFVLDKKYTKPKPDAKEQKPEDYTFGGYMPSSVTTPPTSRAATPGSRGGTAGSRRSVRFADSDSDEGGSKNRLSASLPIDSHRQSDRLGISGSPPKSDSTSDWLGLSTGNKDPEPIKPKVNNTPMITSTPKSSGKTSSADYLGLGDDIDVDSLAQPQLTPPKRATTPDESGLDLFSTPDKRDTTSPFPWDSSQHRIRTPDYMETTDEATTVKSPRTAAMAEQLAQINQFEDDPPKRRPPVDGGKKEPKWRQELKQKQQQQQPRQQQRSPPRDIPPSSPQLPSSSFTAPTITDFSRKQEEIRQQQEKLKIMQQQQQVEKELFIQEQQRRQEEEHRRLQEQLINTKMQSSIPQMTMLDSSDMSLSIAMQNQIRKLELEKKYLEETLESCQKRFYEDLQTMEMTHRNRLKIVEEASERREQRLKQENDEIAMQSLAKLKILEQQKTDLISSHHNKIMEYEDQKLTEIGKLKALHRSTLEELVKDHQLEINRIKRTHESEIDTVRGTHTHTRALQTVIDQVSANAKDLGSLQHKVESQHYSNLDEREIEARQKDEQLKILQQRLSRQQEDNDRERAKLQELISRMESHMSEQAKQLEQERWRVKQEESKLNSLQISLDEERKMLTERMTSERIEIQKAKDNLLTEQKTIMGQLYEERKALAAERAQVSASQKILMEAKQREGTKTMQVEAEREGLMSSLAEQKAELVGKNMTLKQQEETLAKERRALQAYKEELEVEKIKLHDVAETLRKRSLEIAESVNEAAIVKEEGEKAFETSHKIQSEHDQRIASIQSQIKLLRSTEKQIAQDRLHLAKEQKALEEIRGSIMCTKCGGPVSVYTGTPSSVSPAPVAIQTTAPTMQAMQTTINKDDVLQELVVQAEMDRTLRMWRISAEKDKAFLEEETYFLESLKSPALTNSLPGSFVQRV
ncbi:fas-binding factor 1 homolog [Saccoglossus kowalevskii]|uniref:Fas-binding factor 1 homolog n=1 Tax=Saccoglossus kowalevskii TaxID=10224 RepID=A0ABM0GJG3_SACKO|nr:PREDICTED: fas-binding factor 1 homolog [Saccoglossus kowalevskii]